MSNVIIYTEGESFLLGEACKNATDADVKILDVNELNDMENYDPSLIIFDISMAKLKEISMVKKFPVPVIAILDEVPESISVRGEAFDYLINPVSQYELSLKIKNMLKIQELKDKIANISTRDELTGLHNRKYMLERFEAEISRAKRYFNSVSCILFDVDFFKVVNDMYGYEWGDVLLKKLAEMLLSLARKEDIVTRYGDEEFMVILPNTTEENAFIFAERYRRDVEKMQFIPANEEEAHPVKISGGIASYPNMENVDENANTIIRYAEHALYNAKKRGKNKIVLFSQVNLDY